MSVPNAALLLAAFGAAMIVAGLAWAQGRRSDARVAPAVFASLAVTAVVLGRGADPHAGSGSGLVLGAGLLVLGMQAAVLVAAWAGRRGREVAK